MNIKRSIAVGVATVMMIGSASFITSSAAVAGPPGAVKVGSKCKQGHFESTPGFFVPQTTSYSIYRDSGLYCDYKRVSVRETAVPFKTRTTVDYPRVAKIQKNCGSPYIQVC